MHRTFPSYGVHFPADIVFIISRIKTYTRNTKQRDRVHNSYMRHVHIRASLHVCNNNIYTYRNRPNTRMLPCTLTPLYLNRMGWVKASVLGVGDCNFTHDVTHVPLPPLFSTTPLRHIASPYVFCLRTSSISILRNLWKIFCSLSLLFSLYSSHLASSLCRLLVSCSLNLIDSTPLFLSLRLSFLMPAFLRCWNRNHTCSHRLIGIFGWIRRHW